MTVAIIERPQSSGGLAFDLRTDRPPTRSGILPAHDVRAVGLAAVARALGMHVADLGPLVVRRAKADLVHCPVCPAR